MELKRLESLYNTSCEGEGVDEHESYIHPELCGGVIGGRDDGLEESI